MYIEQLDLPFKDFMIEAPTELMEMANRYYKSVENQLNTHFNRALDNDAFGNKVAFCYYKKSHMIHSLFNLIYFIYREKQNQKALYDMGKITEVYGDLYYKEKYGIEELVKPYLCIGIDIKKTFNDVQFDGSVYVTGIGYMYISPSDVNPIFTIFK